MSKCKKCSYYRTDSSVCKGCSENYESRFLPKTPQYCPYCGYDYLLPHKNGSVFCPKCQNHFGIRSEQPYADYAEEVWYDIQGYIGRYQVSNYLRVRSKDRERSDGRKITGKMTAVYLKKNELYTCLYKDGRCKEYNVKKLYYAARYCVSGKG